MDMKTKIDFQLRIGNIPQLQRQTSEYKVGKRRSNQMD